MVEYKSRKTIRTADRVIDGGKALVKATDVVDDSIDTGRALGKASDIAKTNGVGADAATALDTADDVGESAIKRSAKGNELLKTINHPKLKNTVEELYRPGAKIGDGGLADAIRYEIQTGNLVGNKSHIQKGNERLKNLKRILEKEILSEQEKKIAEELIEDLTQALGR